MPLVVMKFGGSSVVDATAIRRVIRIVAAEKDRGRVPIVVVSALGGVTDRLLTLAEQARQGHEAEVEDGTAELRRRHSSEAVELGAEGDGSLALALDTQFAHLHSLLQAIEDCRAADPRALDAIAASGELLSSRLVAAAMTAAGLPAVWVDARDLILTDDRHTCAAPASTTSPPPGRRSIRSWRPARCRPQRVHRARADGRRPSAAEGPTTPAALVGAGLGAEEIRSGRTSTAC
jgi:aspartate kinase